MNWPKRKGISDVASGVATVLCVYGPFGEVIRATGPTAKANPFRFSTKYEDDETDLLYYGYRYYNENTGNWLSRDPSEELGGCNLYISLENDGVNGFDPLGLATVRYEVVVGSYKGMARLAGKWSQPFWAGSGEYFIDPIIGAASTVRLNNEPSRWDYLFPPDAGYCNTVWWSHPDDPNNISGNAGAIYAYVTDDCGGDFHVSGFLIGKLYGQGPKPIYARAWVYPATGTVPITYAEATRGTPVQVFMASIEENVHLHSHPIARGS